MPDTPTGFQSIVLHETDVPGAKLVYKSVKKLNIQLQRWLECRGLTKTGNRSELIQKRLVIPCKQSQYC